MEMLKGLMLRLPRYQTFQSCAGLLAPQGRLVEPTKIPGQMSDHNRAVLIAFNRRTGRGPMSAPGQSRKWPRKSGMTALLSRADIARPSFTLLLVHNIIPKAIDFFPHPPADVPPA